MLPAIFSKGNNLCFRGQLSLLKWGQLLNERICSHFLKWGQLLNERICSHFLKWGQLLNERRVDPIEKGGKPENSRVASPKNVPIHFNKINQSKYNIQHQKEQAFSHFYIFKTGFLLILEFSVIFVTSATTVITFYTPPHFWRGIMFFHVGRPCVCQSVSSMSIRPHFVSLR